MVNWDTKAKILTRIGVTTIVLLVCLYLIIFKYPENYTKWAFGMVGVVVGYWLK